MLFFQSIVFAGWEYGQLLKVIRILAKHHADEFVAEDRRSLLQHPPFDPHTIASRAGIFNKGTEARYIKSS